MQTLTAGSFLNLENAENVEALKFTAQRLAEMTTAVVAENLQPAALENLANDLWQKAQYVTRETERRRLREIFARNFGERFRELKPEVPSAEIKTVEVQQNISAVENNNTIAQSSAPEESVSISNAPAETITEAQEKKDEFLGFVKADEPFAESSAAETDETTTAMRGAPEKNEQPEDALVAREKVSTENLNEIKPQSTPVPAADTKDNPPPVSAVKTGATVSKASETKEPFEFGKCTVTINLTLLPASADERKRRAIVSATSHNSPPEIEFLEISEGEDLAKIAALVRGKLERFTQTLPAKYIEQLRASKTKAAKKPGGVKPTVAATVTAPTKPEIVQSKVEDASGSQPAQSLSVAETEKNRTEIAATKESATAQAAPVAVVPQSVAAATNNVQPSLF